VKAGGRTASALAAVDAFNAGDPRRDVLDGKELPFETAYAERLTRWVLKLEPQASDVLRIAARAQHVGRWTVPRTSYPEGRGGYLRWREDLKKFHATTAGKILASVGYDPASIERVQSLILKKNLKTDPEAQLLEDALCLVFLETQFADLKGKTPDEKMKDIVRKTWAKMGPAGRSAAQALPLPPPLKEFLTAVLAG
jgi:hypothetical protein